MADVGALAGVSAITVSRALKTPDKVTSELRARIQSAAQSLGYVPNRAASALAAARSMNIVVLIPSMTNLVFVDLLAGIHDVLHPRGYQELIGITRYAPAEEERLLGSYLEFQPDGLLITGIDHLPEAWHRLDRMGKPVVHMMELADRPGACSVGLSQEAAGAAMARHLLERGHRRIGFLAAQLDPRALARGAGCRAALQEVGLYDPARELLVPDPSSISLGAELLDRMQRQAPECDALFFCNDDLAQGALFQCRRRGIDVPGDLAIAGFNDLPASAWCTPSLTTIATPRYEVGRRAAEMLLSLLDGQEPASRQIDLGFTLIVREST